MGKFISIIAVSFQIFIITHSGYEYNHKPSLSKRKSQYIPRLIRIEITRKLLVLDDPRGLPQQYYQTLHKQGAIKSIRRNNQARQDKQNENTVQVQKLSDTNPELIDFYPYVIEFDTAIVERILRISQSPDSAEKQQVLKFSWFYQVFQHQLLYPKYQPYADYLSAAFRKNLLHEKLFDPDDVFFSLLIRDGILYFEKDETGILRAVFQQMMGVDLGKFHDLVIAEQVTKDSEELEPDKKIGSYRQKVEANAKRKLSVTTIQRVLDKLVRIKNPEMKVQRVDVPTIDIDRLFGQNLG